jgi:hypothetical protein
MGHGAQVQASAADFIQALADWQGRFQGMKK